ncbi:hypothetical protein EZV62_010351 [Acer yangbiense]|uniref:Programmed cell death protein 2 C-terminal domain-containing protein n=1 Tax=Acer yangbiense TaxID=1000413 RepID=A0A5C7I1Z9_9ROSI|nr:hypothetical protein EZV62_010351 [Acer yangbiense]
MENSVNGDSLEKLKGLQITSLDDDDEEQEQETMSEEFDDDDDYYDDGDDEEEEQEPVTLGFLEKPKNRWSLLRHLFPSKAGGPPAWLDPVNLPSGRSCLCDICGEPLQFLIQVYAPISEKDSTFHRTLFVFMCPSMKCLLRDQHEQCKRLPESSSRRCSVANCLDLILFIQASPQNAMGLTNLLDLEAMHWQTGHKLECQQLSLAGQSSDTNSSNGGTSAAERQKVASKSLWPEYEMINEDESEYDTEMSEDNGHANALISKPKKDDEMNSMFSNFEGDDDRKSWASFQERIGKAPGQVVRYCRSASAKSLWPMSSGRPSKDDIPKCSYCGGPRCFEFQILPQLLYYFNVKNDVDSLDWATIVVYTCEASCEAGVSYKEEFVWVQQSSTIVNVP